MCRKWFLSFVIIISLFVLLGCNQTITNARTACTAEAKVCPDGTAVGRTGPNCEFKKCPDADEGNNQEPEKNICTPEQKNADACIEIYQPVCGWFNQNIQCIKYPCATSFSNSCKACIYENVESWSEGECPK